MQPSNTAPAFTKEPWLISESTNPAVYGGERHLVILSHPDDGTGKIIADLETLPEAKANAEVIARAPQLLQSLERLTEIAESVVGNWENGNLAEAVASLGRIAIDSKALIED